MTEQDISNALRKHLSEMAGVPEIVRENAPGAWDLATGQNTTPEPPFIVVSQIKIPPVRQGLSQIHVHQGRFIAAVMTKEGDEVAEVEGIAEAIVAHFPTDLTLPAGDGEVVVTGHPYHDAGFNDGDFWRVNTHVRWTAFT